MKLIVGLGNPGEEYRGTRHNLGFEVVGDFAGKMVDGKWSVENKFKSEITRIPDVILARPQTFMNQSGIAVTALAKFYKIPPEDIIIIHDELDLELGHIKVRLGGAAAGHHGVENIIEKLGTDQFVRLRLGIGVQKAVSGKYKAVSFNAEHFVIDQFMQNERSTVKRMIKRGVEALGTLLEKGLEKAQNQFN